MRLFNNNNKTYAVSGTSSTTTTSASSTSYYDPSIKVYYEPITYNTYTTSVGTKVNFFYGEEKSKKVIHPQLYFKFVKSKLNKLEEKKLNHRLLTLQKFVKSAKDLGQQALYEEFARKIAIVVREQELWACGVELYVDREVVTKYMDKVKDVEIGFSKLENFDRPLPAIVSKRVQKFKKLKLLDEMWVLYLNYENKKDVDNKVTKEKKLKTNKEKIKEKDPILFGVQNHAPDKLYFIIDWIDDYCDVTLDKFIDDVKKDDPNYNFRMIDDIDEKLIKKLVKESRERYVRLKNTNVNNYRGLMEVEDSITKAEKKREKIKHKTVEFKNNIIKKIKKVRKND